MALLQKAIGLELLNQVLPTFGSSCELKGPVWNESQKMFITNEYESASGNRYYCGIRFSDNLVIVEKIGLAHTWTFLDGIELYRFDGTKLVLIQKKDYSQTTYRKDEFVLAETKTLLKDYFIGFMKQNRAALPADLLEEKVNQVVSASYKSYLDSDYNVRLTSVVKEIESRQQLSLPQMKKL